MDTSVKRQESSAHSATAGWLLSCRFRALVIAGSRDEAAPLAMSEAIARSIAGDQRATLDAAHLSAVEQPEAFADTLARFLQNL